MKEAPGVLRTDGTEAPSIKVGTLAKLKVASVSPVNAKEPVEAARIFVEAIQAGASAYMPEAFKEPAAPMVIPEVVNGAVPWISKRPEDTVSAPVKVFAPERMTLPAKSMSAAGRVPPAKAPMVTAFVPASTEETVNVAPPPPKKKPPVPGVRVPE